jgi:hypothetical protein
LSQPSSRIVSDAPHHRRTAPPEEVAPVPCSDLVSFTAPGTRAVPGLFEHFVGRVAGLPVEAMEELRAEASASALDEAAAAEAALEAESGALADALHAAVGATEERRLRHRLLQLRRDVHNLRRPSQADVAAGRQVLHAAAAAALERYGAAAGRRQRVLADLPRLHAADLARCRRRFRRRVADDDFRNGLLLSSRVLFDELERYRSTPPADFTAKERQIERGLLRYLSRMAMKTSPFSTFNALMPGRLVAEAEAGAGGPLLRIVGDPGRKHGVVRLNKRVLWVLRRKLAADAEARGHFDVELNSTLHRDGDRWCFLTSLDGREAFQRLQPNPVIDLYQELLASGPRRWTELEERIAGSPAVEASGEAVSAYSERLLDVGFLRFRFGVPPQEADWDRPLTRRLEGAVGEVAAAVRELLTALREGCDRFAAAPVADRPLPLDAATEVLRGSFPELTRRTSLRADVPFYEDAGAVGELLLAKPELAAAEETLVHYVRLTSRLAWPRHELATMRRFFDRRYRGRPVPLLRFYEDFYRGFQKEHLERQAALLERLGGGAGDEEEAMEAPAGEGGGLDTDGGYDPSNPLRVEAVTQMQRARERLSEAVRERWRCEPRAERLDLPRRVLDEALGGLPAVAAETFSSSAFVQVLPGEAADGGPALLLSSLMPGYGKYFSRFLAVLPRHLQAALIDRNTRVEGVILAEICADGDFNGNLHPPLVPWELVYPTVESGSTEHRLHAAELVVEPHPADRLALCLRPRRGGARVLPLDLGFQNPRMRPPLFQLLSQLSPAAGFGFPVPDRLGEATAAGEGGVEHRPRVVYDGRLVLSRRRWQVPPEQLPLRRGNETEAEHFLRVDRWRRRHGIPRQVFASIHQPRVLQRAAAAGDGEARRQRRGHLHKPQYVDFADPLLVDLFGRLAEEDELMGCAVLLHERLPDARHLAREGGRGWVTELAMQIDFPAGLDADG